MMYSEETKNMPRLEDDSDSDDSDSSSEEIPIWVRGEQRWVSGVIPETTCQEVVQVLVQNEKHKGKHIGDPSEYHITERWRGVEQPLDPQAKILDIWNAWSSAREEIKISLRRIKSDKPCNRRLKRTDSSTFSDRNSWKTLHPKRLASLQNEKESTSNTEELLKLVLAQGEVIRRQLKKLRHSEHQIGYLEDKTHRARVRKHGSNYLLETYLKGLPEADNPDQENVTTDKNSDSGVVTEGDSEQSNNVKKSSKSEKPLERFSPSTEEFVHQEDANKDDDTNSTTSESVLREQRDLLKKISKVNKQLLKQEECLVRLEVNLKKYEKYKNATDDVTESLANLRTEMTKSTCEMQHNQIVLEETNELINSRKYFLENLHKDIVKEEQEHEVLQALLSSSKNNHQKNYKSQNYISYYNNYRNHNTKELFDTLV